MAMGLTAKGKGYRITYSFIALVTILVFCVGFLAGNSEKQMI